MALYDLLTEEQEKVLESDYSVVWQTLRDRGTSGLTRDDYDVLSTMDQAPLSDQFALFEDADDGPKVANMFCNLLGLCKTSDKEDQLRYVSLWLRVLLTSRPSLGAKFFEIKQNPIKPCVDILYRPYGSNAEEIKANIAVAASVMISNDVGVSEDNVEVKKFGLCLTDTLTEISKKDNNDSYYVESFATCLKNCLKCSLMFNFIFFSDESARYHNFADMMNKFIEKETSFQVLYLQGFSLLLVALKRGSNQRKQISEHANLCKTMINLVASARTEPVRRMYLQVIECLSDISDFAELCVMYGLYATLQRLNEENFKDDDIKTILETLMSVLKPHVRVMSSMERYEKELKTKTLEMGPVHSEAFWKKNYMAFERNDFQLIKDLTALLDSQDVETVKVAAFDIGEFARLYPDGRRIVSTFGAKRKLFSILETTDDEEQRKQVLLATQKILVHSWHQID